MGRIEQINHALIQCQARARWYPNDPMWPILIDQLMYLRSNEQHLRQTKGNPTQINIGEIAARLMSVDDQQLAALLSDIGADAKRRSK
jgi:hypothetical protein